MRNPLNQDEWQNIFKFLTSDEAFALRCTCTAFNATATSNHIVMPFLNRLKAINSKISVLPPQGISNSWCFERFTREFQRLAQAQALELKNFLPIKVLYIPFRLNGKFIHVMGNLWITNDPDIYRDMARLKVLAKDPHKNKFKLSALEENHHTLKRLNEALIVSCIDLNSPILDLTGLGITQFPESLFTKSEYQNYWNTLVQIRCDYNKLKVLPEGLGKCQALELLSCRKNQLQSLPRSLVKCQALHTLYCQKNRLESLPDAIGNCRSLQYINCAFNHLQELPKSLSNCPLLWGLDSSYNLLQALPQNLGHLNYQRYRGNPAQFINPEGLRETLPLLACIVLISIMVFTITFPLVTALLLGTMSAFLLGITLGIIYTCMMVRVAYVRNHLSPSERYKYDDITCDLQLAKLAELFTTNTGQAFIHNLKEMEHKIPPPVFEENSNATAQKPNEKNKLAFKQFEIHAYKRVAYLRNQLRANTKDDILAQAKKFVT